MTHQEKLAFIRGKCIEAGAEIELKGCTCKLMHDENGCLVGKHYRSVRLADVIRLFTHFSMPDVTLSVFGNPEPGLCGLLIEVKKKKAIWKLDRDLDDQDESTISFLYDILK